MGSILKQIKRTQSRAALFYIDLDGFKKINDWGHDAGDFVLKEVALRLQNVARESDTVVRVGGDEFAILFTNIVDSNFIHDMAARINSSIDKPISHQERTYALGCSIGVAVAPDHTENASELLKRSDKAMYQAKKEGKNSYHIYSNYS